MPSRLVAGLAAAAGTDVPAALAAAVTLVARDRGLDVALEVDGEPISADPRVLAADVDRGLLARHGPWLPGMLREALTSPASRRRSGVHHTDPAVARGVTALAIAGHDPSSVLIGDPSVGGGAFLLAAAELLEPHGGRSEVVGRLRGVDVDPLAVAVTSAALHLWSGQAVRPDRVSVGDFLGGCGFGPDPVDVVVGNPPFLGQLKAATTRSRRRADEIRNRWPGIGGYVDEGALFILAGLDAVGPEGTVALIQPVSVLSARDARTVRARVVDEAVVAGFWLARDRVFDAGVDTCAVVVSRSDVGAVERVVGPSFERRSDHPLPTDPASWGSLMADLIGVPEVARPETAVRLGDVARCTAGFRDQYYGLRRAVTDDPDREPRLVTSGLIDPLVSRWGERACRFDRRRWETPSIDRTRVEPEVEKWVRDRLRPKLLVASQTRVLEVVVDEKGTWVPSTPVVSVEPGSAAPSLWHLAAALTAPQASAWLATESAGSALSRDALRVSAPRVADLPLPPEGPGWDEAAAATRAAAASRSRIDLEAAAMAAARAYGSLPDGLFRWWADRLPAPERTEPAGRL